MKEIKYHLLLSPAIVLNLLVVFIPGVLTVLVSFTNWNGVSSTTEWVGIRNFVEISQDWIFWQALSNNIRWTVLFVTIPVIIGLLSAYLMVRRQRTRSLFQAIFLLPFILAPITNALLWSNIIFNPLAGMVGYLKKIGWNVFNPLAYTETSLYGVAVVDIWHYWGFLAVVYLAAMRQTPEELIEAALIDGINSRQLFRYIYLPFIRPTIQMMFVMITIFSFLTFDYIYLLTSGGPAHSSEMLSTYAYTFAFSTFQVGKAAAVALVMGFFGIIASFFYVWMNRRGSDQ